MPFSTPGCFYSNIWCFERMTKLFHLLTLSCLFFGFEEGVGMNSVRTLIPLTSGGTQRCSQEQCHMHTDTLTHTFTHTHPPHRSLCLSFLASGTCLFPGFLSGSIFLTSGPFAALAQILKPEGSCPACVLGDTRDQGGREMDGPRGLGQEVQQVLGPRRVPPRPHLLSVPVSPAGR